LPITDSNKGIKNVNIIIPNHDTLLITDTAGIADLTGLLNIDTLIIKKFGYKKQIITDKQRHIHLEKDTAVYSHDLKLLDLKYQNKFSLIKFSISGEVYWFKQNDMLNLGNGREIDIQDWNEIVYNHKIIRTVFVCAECCLNGIIGENSANRIYAIYYSPSPRNKKIFHFQNRHYLTINQMNRFRKTLKLESGCLN